MKRKLLIALWLIAGIASLLLLALSLRVEYERNVFFEDGASAQEVYSMYIQGDLMLSERAGLGVDEAPLTAIAVIDFDDPNAAMAYDEVIIPFEHNYMQDGQARMVLAYVLTEEDIAQKRGRFIKAQASHCYISSGKANASAFVRALISAPTEEVAPMLADAGITMCDAHETLRIDAYETAVFRIVAPSLSIGIAGDDMTTLYGTPSAERVHQVVREKQVKLGI